MPLAHKFLEVPAAICIALNPQTCSCLLCHPLCLARTPSTCPAVLSLTHQDGCKGAAATGTVCAKAGQCRGPGQAEQGAVGHRGPHAAAGSPAAFLGARCARGVTRGRAVPGQQTPQDASEELHRVRGTGTAAAVPQGWSWGDAAGCGGGPAPITPQNLPIGSSQEQIWERDGGEAGQVQTMYQNFWKSIKALQARQV